MFTFKEKLFILAVGQHYRRKNKKFNICWLINIFYPSYHDYCMEAWIAWVLENKNAN